MITLPWKIGWAHFNQGPKVNAPCIQPNRKSDMLYLHIIPSQTTISSHPEIADRLLKWACFPLSTQSLLSAPQTNDPFKTWIRWSHFSEQNFLLSSSPSETKPKRALTMTPHPQGSAPESPTFQTATRAYTMWTYSLFLGCIKQAPFQGLGTCCFFLPATVFLQISVEPASSSRSCFCSAVTSSTEHSPETLKSQLPCSSTSPILSLPCFFPFASAKPFEHTVWLFTFVNCLPSALALKLGEI